MIVIRKKMREFLEEGDWSGRDKGKVEVKKIRNNVAKSFNNCGKEWKGGKYTGEESFLPGI